jgi:hypothetical protein
MTYAKLSACKTRHCAAAAAWLCRYAVAFEREYAAPHLRSLLHTVWAIGTAFGATLCTCLVIGKPANRKGEQFQNRGRTLYTRVSGNGSLLLLFA